MWAWGRNTNGECAFDTRDGVSAFPRKIPSLSKCKVIQLAGGANHSTAVTSDGRCFAWGRMDVGQLGNDFTPEQRQDEKLLRRGIQGRPQVCAKPLLVPGVGQVVNVACGVDHTLFVNTDGKAFSTGFGFNGQLGHRSENDLDVAKEVKGGVRDMRVSQARAGGHFSILVSVAEWLD